MRWILYHNDTLHSCHSTYSQAYRAVQRHARPRFVRWTRKAASVHIYVHNDYFLIWKYIA